MSTDTGDLVLGHRDFTRYTTVPQCLAATQKELEYQRHTLAAREDADLLRDTAPDLDTLPAPVIAVAQQCSAKFSLATTPVHDLLDLWQLALYAQHDAEAYAIESRLLAATPAGHFRFALMDSLALAYLDQEPARIALADSLEATLVAAGPPARLDADLVAARSVSFFKNKELRPEMTVSARRLIARFPSIVRDYPVADHAWMLNRFYTAWEELVGEAYVHHPADVPQLFSELRAAFQAPLVRQLVAEPGVGNGDNPATWSAERLTERFGVHVSWWEPPVAGVFPLHAEYWFPGAQGTDSLTPPNRSVALVIRFPENCWDMLQYDLSSEDCTTWVRGLQHMVRAYSPMGLKTTIVAMTHGRGIGDTPEDPSREAKMLAWLIQDYWGLPVTVAVRRTAVTRLPEPDGRVVQTSLADELSESGSEPIQWSWDDWPWPENFNGNRLDNFIILLDGDKQLINLGENLYPNHDRLIRRLLQLRNRSVTTPSNRAMTH